MKNLLITKTLTFKPDDPLLPFGKYVFQRVRPGFGNLPDRPRLDLQLRRHVVPTDPKTVAQMARRALFAAAVARWRAPMAGDLDRWSNDAQNRAIPVFNAALSDVLRNYHLSGGVLVKNNP